MTSVEGFPRNFDGPSDDAGPQDAVIPDTAENQQPSADDAAIRSFVLVDGQVAPNKSAPDRDGREVLPGWAKDRSTLRSVISGVLVRWFRVLSFHTVRVPVYVVRLLGLSPLGFWRALRLWAGWVFDSGYSDDRLVLKANGGDIGKLRVEHRSTMKNRALTSLIVGLLALTATAIAVAALHPIVVVVLTVGVLCGLGGFGSPMTNRPVVERATYRVPEAPAFTESLMLSALRQCDAEPKGARQIQVIQPPARIRSGWEAIVSVGVESSGVIKRRARFATVLNRPENCVWLTADPEQAAGWLRIVVTRTSLRRGRMPAWPLLDSGSLNWFTDNIPIGVDETGELIAVPKAYRSTVYGGLMNSGKTGSMITSLAGQMSDPRVEGHFYDLKGGTDWEPFAPIAHTYISGTEPADHKAVEADAEALNRRMDKRFKTLKTLPDGLKSPKTNDQLASLRHLDLHPIVVVIDETQELFEFSPKPKRMYELIARIVKRGRAVGMTVEAGTQEVNQKTLPIAGLCHWRMCHGVQGHNAVDQVLGTGAYHAGFNADALTTEDVGIGYFGSGKEIGVVKSYYIKPDNGDLDRVIKRFHTHRQQQNLLTGSANKTPDDDVPVESMLDRVTRTWPKGVTSLQWVELVNLLHDQLPEDFPKVTDLDNGVPPGVAKAVEALSAQLAQHGVASTDVRSRFLPKAGKTSGVRKGLKWTDLTNTRLDNPLDTDADIGQDIATDSQQDIDADTEQDTAADSQQDIQADPNTDTAADNQRDIQADPNTDIAADSQRDIQADPSTDTAADSTPDNRRRSMADTHSDEPESASDLADHGFTDDDAADIDGSFDPDVDTQEQHR